MREAMALADNLMVMSEGRIVVSGTPSDVFKSNNETVRQLRGSGDILW